MAKKIYFELKSSKKFEPSQNTITKSVLQTAFQSPFRDLSSKAIKNNFLVYENLELTVPEPSLFEDEDDTSTRPVTSTQLPSAEKSVKFNLTEIDKKSRKSEPVNFHSQSMPVQAKRD